VYFSGVSVLHYLQSVLPNVAVGGEVAYQYGSGIPGGGIAVISGVGRYTGI
jgi:mitochondrial import receptor subunit TOM40